MAATVTPRINHHQLTMNRLALMIIWVNAGRSAPKLWNVCSNCGTTKISRIALTRIATTITVAGYAAILITLPLILFQAYAFILPAFSPQEKSVAMPLLLTVPALFLLGVTFTYFVVLPGAVAFLQNFNAENFDILIQARPYYQFSVVMMAGIGLLFQIPIAVMAVTRLGIISPAQLKQNRAYYVLGVAVVAAIGNGSPDPFTMIFVMIPLIVLFEISVQLASWLERRDLAREAELAQESDSDASDDEPW